MLISRGNFNVLETKYQNINDSSFAINEEVSIDFEYYKNLVLAYEETYGVQIDGVLKVRFNMEFLNLNGKKITDVNYVLSNDDFSNGHAILKKGKKVFFKLEI